MFTVCLCLKYASSVLYKYKIMPIWHFQYCSQWSANWWMCEVKNGDNMVSRPSSEKKKISCPSAENSLYTQTRLRWRLISISSKCWIPLNINHWTAEFIWTLTKLLSIICPALASCAVYVVYLFNSLCWSRKGSILCCSGTFIKMYSLPLCALF